MEYLTSWEECRAFARSRFDRDDEGPRHLRLRVSGRPVMVWHGSSGAPGGHEVVHVASPAIPVRGEPPSDRGNPRVGARVADDLALARTVEDFPVGALRLLGEHVHVHASLPVPLLPGRTLESNVGLIAAEAEALAGESASRRASDRDAAVGGETTPGGDGGRGRRGDAPESKRHAPRGTRAVFGRRPRTIRGWGQAEDALVGHFDALEGSDGHLGFSVSWKGQGSQELRAAHASTAGIGEIAYLAAPLGSGDATRVRAAMAVVDDFLVGGVAVDGDELVLKASVPLAGIALRDFLWIVEQLALGAREVRGRL